MRDEKPIILVVDDEGDIYRYGERFLSDEYSLEWVKNGQDAISFLEKNRVNIVLLDKNFSKIDKERLLGNDPINEGIAILEVIKKRWDIPVLLVTSYADPVSMIKAIQHGVDDYIEWDALSIDEEILKHRIKKILKEKKLEEELLISKYNSMGLIGRTPEMVEVFRAIEKAAQKDVTVLIVGETGTGKEVVAQAIHRVSEREGPFIPVNLSALPKELIESELFGFKRGAFTGAYQDKPGFFEMADGGTLFIDEVSELPKELQVKLLRVLEEKAFFPLGSKKPVKVDVRLIAATNVYLEEKVKKGDFREDLYYRLKVFTIEIPPLDKRKEDIPLLVDYFVSFYAKSKGFPVFQVTEEAKKYLMEMNWPGNVRQLENTILRAMTFADRVLTLKDVVKATQDRGEAMIVSQEVKRFLSSTPLKRLEKIAIEETLKLYSYNFKKAAQSLGIGLSTLYTKVREFGIIVPK